MGVPNLNDGSIERADLDGKNRRIIVPPGGTFTPKQLHLDKANGKLYWSDREGMRVMRCESRRLARSKPWSRRAKAKLTAATRRDGASESPSTPSADKSTGRKKGRTMPESGRILRAGIDIPKGETPVNRTDIEVLFDDLPEPIDLELDLEQPRPLLDRPRQSPARQHGQSRADRREARTGRAPRSSSPI